MNRLLFALALTAAAAAGGCRAMGPHRGQNCGDACCADSCGGASCGCCDECRGNLYDEAMPNCPECASSNSGLFRRYCGPGNGCDGGCGAPCGEYDCSAYDTCGCGGRGCHLCPCCGQPGPGCCCCCCCCCGASGDHRYNFAPGPPVGQTAYPYYTVRGPRDFLLNNPPPLGPY